MSFAVEPSAGQLHSFFRRGFGRRLGLLLAAGALVALPWGPRVRAAAARAQTEGHAQTEDHAPTKAPTATEAPAQREASDQAKSQSQPEAQSQLSSQAQSQTDAQAKGRAAAAGVTSSPQLIDRVVAIVDEEAILQSDLEREVESYRFEARSRGEDLDVSDGKIREQMLDRLIEVKLLVAQAKADGVAISDEELERSVGRVMQELIDRYGTRRDLERELARSGMTYEDLEARQRELIRNRMYTSRMINTYIRPRVEVREDQVRRYYEEHHDEVPARPDQLTLANILVLPQPSPEARVRIREKLGGIQKELASGVAFPEVARKYSEGPNAANGGLVGQFHRGDLYSPLLERAAWELPVGEVSEPITTDIGVHLLEVDERTEDSLVLRQIFLRLEITDREREAAAKRAEEVARLARSGQDFAELARKYSDDPGSREKGGLLGTFPVPQLSEAFRKAIEGLGAGEVADPVRGAAGWFVLKVVDRQEGGVPTYEEIHDQLRSLVEEQMVQAELEKFLGELRQRFYIDIKT